MIMMKDGKGILTKGVAGKNLALSLFLEHMASIKKAICRSWIQNQMCESSLILKHLPLYIVINDYTDPHS